MRPSRPARRTERRSSMGLSGRGFAHSRMGVAEVARERRRPCPPQGTQSATGRTSIDRVPDREWCFAWIR
jgi:hypothetical protein